MEVSSLQIGFDALVSILSALVGALTVWFTLKNKVAIQQIVLENLQKEIIDLKSEKKDNNQLLHKRIDELSSKVDNNRERNDQALADIVKEMAAMELRIIQAINGKEDK
jgi:gas vesicle protein